MEAKVSSIIPTSSFEEVDLMTVPVKALNVSSRSGLSWFLNPEQPLRSSKNEVRDYRGLAEQMGFEYNDIKNFRRSEDPTLKVIEAWEGKPNSTIGVLLEYLENMDRHDVLDDLMKAFRKDACNYVRKMRSFSEHPIQVPEVTPGPSAVRQSEDPNALTVGDAEFGDCTYYDAYVCYAKEDLECVMRLARFLESPEIGLKLFIKDRDLLIGASELESHAQLIQERCHRMVIMLSPDFLKSPECEFQTSFAAGLAVEQRKRILIPILIAPCEVPLILKFISKIDFTKPVIPDFQWQRLIKSINGTASSIFVLNSSCSFAKPALGFCQASDGIGYPSNPIVTYPPTEVLTDTSTAQPSLTWPSVSVSENFGEQSFQSSQQLRLLVASENRQKTTPPPKRKWFGKIKECLKSNSSTSTTNASLATSGYHTNNSITGDNQEDSAMKSVSEDLTF